MKSNRSLNRIEALTSIFADHPDALFVMSNGLTSREAAVASKLAGALGEADIARDLNISGNTLRSHRKAIYAKLGITSRAAFSALVARLM